MSKTDETNNLAAPQMLRVRDFCQRYRCSRSWAYQRIADGSLQSLRVHGSRFIPISAAAKFFSGEANNAA